MSKCIYNQKVAGGGRISIITGPAALLLKVEKPGEKNRLVTMSHEQGAEFAAFASDKREPAKDEVLYQNCTVKLGRLSALNEPDRTRLDIVGSCVSPDEVFSVELKVGQAQSIGAALTRFLK